MIIKKCDICGVEDKGTSLNIESLEKHSAMIFRGFEDVGIIQAFKQMASVDGFNIYQCTHHFSAQDICGKCAYEITDQLREWFQSQSRAALPLLCKKEQQL